MEIDSNSGLVTWTPVEGQLNSDIIYEKKIPLMITSQVNLNQIKSAKNISEPFKRTISRLYELTSISYS